MKKAILIRGLLASGLLLSGLSTAVLAKDGISGNTSDSSTSSGSTSTGSHSETETSTSTSTAVKTETSAPESENQIEVERHTLEQEAHKMRQDAKLAEKLDDAKKRQCDKVSANITKHIQNFIRFANNQIEVFDSISQKVQDFAAKKNLKAPEEASLLTQLSASKTKVQQDIDTLKTDAESFTCDGTNPKGALKAFHTDAALVRADLKAYRNLVRQLIQAIRKANGQTADKTTKTEDQTNAGVTTNAAHQ